MVINLKLDIVPFPLPRARHSGRNGIVRSYYKKEQVAVFDKYIELIKKSITKEKQEIIDNCINQKDLKIEVDVMFYMPIPNSYSKKKKESLTQHNKLPDLDNLIKMVLDRAEGILFNNDNCITKIVAEKVYDKYPRIDLTLKYVV